MQEKETGRRLYSHPAQVPMPNSKKEVMDHYGDDWFEPQDAANYLKDRERGHREKVQRRLVWCSWWIQEEFDQNASSTLRPQPPPTLEVKKKKEKKKKKARQSFYFSLLE